MRWGMKGRAVLTLGCVLVLVASTAVADLGEIKQRGTLRVLVSVDEMPEMFSLEASETPGLEREMVEAFSRAHGLDVEVVPVENWERIIPSLVEGKGDLIIGIVDTESRRERIDFSGQTLPARHVAVNRKPAPPIGDLEALRAARVGVVVASSWAEAALDAGVEPHRIVAYELRQGAIEALRRGEVQAMVMTLTDFAQARASDPELQVGLFVGKNLSGAWGVRKEDPQLRAALTSHLEALQGSVFWGRMVLRYFSEDAVALLAQARE